jgi:hypothetical protein
MPARPTETDYLLTWLWFFICATVGGALAGALVGAASGATLGAAGVTSTQAVFVIGGASFVASGLLSYLFFRLFVKRLVLRTLGQSAATTNAA